jgi:hypothetical protein
VIGAITILAILTLWAILLYDYNVLEIRQACSNNLFNIMLVSIIIYPVVLVTAEGQSVHFEHGHTHDKMYSLFVFCLIASVLRISFAYENIHNEICLNATSTKYSGQIGLASAASLEKFAYFVAAVEFLGISVIIIDSVNSLLLYFA